MNANLMQDTCKTIADYRKMANLTQEETAFSLHIGVRTLAYYEAGKLNTPPEILVKMARLYDAPILIKQCARNYEDRLYELYQKSEGEQK